MTQQAETCGHLDKTEKEQFKDFVILLEKQAIRKADENFDGMRNTMAVDSALRLGIEEIGEVATAITRKRTLSALYECLDMAHCAFLIWLAIKRELQREEEVNCS